MSDEQVLQNMQSILREENAYFAKFIDAFLELSAEHQKGFVQYIMGYASKTHWEEAAKDPTMYLVVIRGILSEFSGRPEMFDPSKTDLAGYVADYADSNSFEEVEELKNRVDLKDMLRKV